MVRIRSKKFDRTIFTFLVMLYLSILPIQAQYSGIGEPNNPSPADGSIYEDTGLVLSWSPGDYTVSHDVYFGDNFDDVKNGAKDTFQGNQEETVFIVGFTGFLYPDGLIPGMTYYWRIDEVNESEPNSPRKGPVWSFSIPPRTAYNPDPADNSESVELGIKLSWTTGFEAKLHTVYFGDNFNDINNANGGFPQGITTYTPAPLELAKTYYWRVDEFDGINTHKGDVWSFITQGAVGDPEPINGDVDVTRTPILMWTHGIYADSHQVYFGTDKDAVKNADTSSFEYKGSGNLGSESYDPGNLSLDTTYYWKINEVNNTHSDSPWKGPVWSFTTADFLIVDDFESYNELDPDDPKSNRIFETWIDGWDDPFNGSYIGDVPPWVDIMIAHGGWESMTFSYDNSGLADYSEVTMTLNYPRDWTAEGVSVLSLWFGDLWPWSSNTPESMYIRLTNRDGTTATVYHDNPDATTIKTWTEWIIDLQAFADQGMNLKDAHTISIGFGDRNNPQPGGSGVMYFDDIRLYRPDAEPVQ